MERDTKHHIEEEWLEAYAMNSLGEDEVAIIEEHLLFCITCQNQMEAVDHYIQAMQAAATRIRKEEIEAPVPPGAWDRVRGWLRTPVPVWTGALAMIGLVLMVGLEFQERPPLPPLDVALQAIRGAPTGPVEAGHPLHLQLDNRGVPEMPSWRIEIVNEVGTRVWTGMGTSAGLVIKAAVDKPFHPGTYFVRLLKDGDGPVREYQLVVQKAVPSP